MSNIANMKKINNYIILLLAVIVLPLITSCFKDSDADNSFGILDDKEKVEYLKKMKGTYNGKCYYSYLGKGDNNAPVLKEDSLMNVTWTLLENGDITISKLPVSMITGALNGGSQFAFLSDAISKCTDVTVEGKVVPYRTINNWDYPFYIYPKENITLNVEDKGRKYKVVLYFDNVIKLFGLNFTMEGVCKIHENQMLFTLPIGSISVNDVQSGATPSMYRYLGAKKAEEQDKKN